MVYHHATLHNKIESLFFDLFVSVWLIGSQQNYASEKFRPDPFFQEEQCAWKIDGGRGKRVKFVYARKLALIDDVFKITKISIK